MVETTWDQLGKEDGEFKKDVEKKYGIKTKDELKRKVDLILHKNKIREYKYVEESFGASVEPKYFWIIDFIRKFGFTVEKHKETMGASVVSQFFGEISSRKTVMEKRGMEIMVSINGVIRSIINLLYDLREFDRRLKVYAQLKSEDAKVVSKAEQILKRVWMDEVDSKKGMASINSMAQKLEFVTLRDAFMMTASVKEIEKMEVNYENVKT